MLTLCNKKIRLDIDEHARITWLEDRTSGNGNVIVDPKPVFRAAIFRTTDALGTGDNKEDMAFAQDQNVTVEQVGEKILVTVEDLKTKMGVKKARIVLTMELNEEGIVFGGIIENQSESCMDELIYPCVGALKSLGCGAADLLFPKQCGRKIPDICSVLKGKTTREELHEMSAPYPGPLSMSWMALTDKENCLYFASYDPLFHAMSMRVKGSKEGPLALEMDKMCFVKKGETWEIPKAVARLYQGSWRQGADAYVKWAGTWRHPIQQAEWIKKVNGYFLVINKQQYGYESWPYETLPEIYDYAKAHGLDSLGLFGWYHTGHDNNYPDLDVSPTLGGEEGLKAGIQEVQRNGGHVTLYFQGHLMDLNSPFYKREGEKWESKNIWGTTYYEFYPKFCYSDKLRFFSRKAFSNICPSVRLWHKMMADRIDWIADFGADGALYDQVGGMLPYLCFNEQHEHMHGKPSLSYTQGRLKMFDAIRERVAKYPEFAFMSEHITDLYSQFLDCIHGMETHPDESNMPELFRYCFPDTMITVRNSRPYMDERLTNYAFAYGFKFEMELRYDTDQIQIREDQEPEKRMYAKQVATLRRQYEDHLLLGAFRADEGIRRSNLIVNVFVAADGSRVVAVWNDSEAPVKPELEMEKGTVAGWSTISGEGEGLPGELQPNEIAVIRIAAD